MIERIRLWLLPRLVESWRTTLAGMAVLAFLALFWLDPPTLRLWAEKISAIGEVAMAATSAIGTVVGLATAVGLALWHREGDGR